MTDFQEYLSAVENHLSDMSREDMRDWIINQARIQPEGRRWYYLQQLRDAGVLDEDLLDYLKKQKVRVSNWLKKVQRADFCVEKYMVETYNEGHWDSDYEERYLDSDNIAQNLEEAFRIADKLLTIHQFKESYELFEKLFDISVAMTEVDGDFSDEYNPGTGNSQVGKGNGMDTELYFSVEPWLEVRKVDGFDIAAADDENEVDEVDEEERCLAEWVTDDENADEWEEDASDYERLNIGGLLREDLISIDIKRYYSQFLYACYWTHSGGQRLRKLYELLIQSPLKTIKMEDVICSGPLPLEGLPDFWVQWHGFLVTQEGDKACQYLTEACQSIGLEVLQSTAYTASSKHPGIYLNLCQSLLDRREYDTCIKSGMEALEHLSKDLCIRSDIAKIMKVAAASVNKQETIELCSIESFTAVPTFYHALQLFQDICDRQKICSTMAMLDNVPHVSKRSSNYFNILYNNEIKGQLRTITALLEEEYLTLLFLRGDYATVYEACKMNDEYLGWSSSIKGCLVPLFLLLLYPKRIFSKTMETLLQGILQRLIPNQFNQHGDDDQYKPYLNMLHIWSQKNAQIDADEEAEYLEWLKQQIDGRVKNILEHNYRSSYGKGAILLCVYGEILQSRGVETQAEWLERYIRQYSRRSAFRSELNHYAMD